MNAIQHLWEHLEQYLDSADIAELKRQYARDAHHDQRASTYRKWSLREQLALEKLIQCEREPMQYPGTCRERAEAELRRVQAWLAAHQDWMPK